ncbi:MAG: hypothetical protein Q9P01_08485, partial [Anaerolineae bacterium]|nr:hypothetical protein [Anaerolineae bacterium]
MTINIVIIPNSVGGSFWGHSPPPISERVLDAIPAFSSLVCSNIFTIRAIFFPRFCYFWRHASHFILAGRFFAAYANSTWFEANSLGWEARDWQKHD